MIRDARIMRALLIVLAGLLTGLIVAVGGFGMSAVWLGVIVGIPAFAVALSNPHLGAVIIFSLGYVLLGVKRASEGLQLGVAADVILLALILGVFLRRTQTHDWSAMKSPIAIAVIVWLLYTLLEFFNPAACSPMLWVLNIRSAAGYMLMYFVAVDVLDKPERVRFYIWFLIAWAVLGALYGMKQESFGFTKWEWAWIGDPAMKRHRLLYQWGVIRKFSFFSDPVSFGVTMAITGVICWAIIFGAPGIKKKIIASIAIVLVWWSMVFSGTRSAYMIIPLGIFFVSLLMANRKMYVAGGLGAVVLFFLIMVPTQNTYLKRFRSAFQPTESNSYNVRIENQKLIRPYIWSHPFGGGLGSTGLTGRTICPGSPLSWFPPDSGYVRVAVELGWVGLLMHLGVWVTVLWVGIRRQASIRDPFMKAISAGTLGVVFALAVVNYAQQTIFQLPLSLLFWFLAALVDRAPVLDRAIQRERDESEGASGIADQGVEGVTTR